ncbi:DUF2800 domain-containing protein [Chengkuizengella sp. SCS-71B]|uniref:DUF2800 domain-containing protein n=1 Tax=Chengkuizengella sp. SCS-71B TaxID=3115290 RepID=UPI0032C235C2
MSSTHSERAHAKLSASGSSRWLACPGSVRLEEMFPDTSSSYADEGTAAHELSELKLQLHMGEIKKRTYNAELKKLKQNEQFASFYSQEMEDYVQNYVDTVIERINAAKAKTPDAIVLLEQKLDFSQWVPPNNFGTGDVVIIAEGHVDVIDLKYGKGVQVSAFGNSQMRLYGLGALHEFEFLYGVDEISMTIVQPRLDNITTETLSAEELLKWAEIVVKPGAKKTTSNRPSFKAGDHCKFCKARSHCRARAMANLELLEYEFQDPPLLSTEEIADVLAKADELKKWAGEVQDYAFDQALNHGIIYPGWKLVTGRSNRKYRDEKEVEDTLILEGYEENKITKKKLLGITAMENLVGKKRFNELLKDLIIKPEGKPVLVTESDKRPALSSLSEIESEFADMA